MTDLQSACYIYTITHVTFKFLFEERSDAKALAHAIESLRVINFCFKCHHLLFHRGFNCNLFW